MRNERRRCRTAPAGRKMQVARSMATRSSSTYSSTIHTHENRGHIMGVVYRQTTRRHVPLALISPQAQARLPRPRPTAAVLLTFSSTDREASPKAFKLFATRESPPLAFLAGKMNIPCLLTRAGCLPETAAMHHCRPRRQTQTG